MRRSFALFSFLGVVALSIGLFAGCNRKTADAPSAKADEEAPSFTTVKPERKTLKRTIEQPAYITAYEETPLLVRVAGYVHKIHCDIGSVVKGPVYDSQGTLLKPGQVLAELWVPEMEEEHRQKAALITQAEAEVKQAQGTLAAAEAHILTAKAVIREMQAAVLRAEANSDRWSSEHKRMQTLAKNQVIDLQSLEEVRHQWRASQAALEEAKAKVESAKAQATESEAKRDKVKADVDAAHARVKVAEAEERRVAALLEYSKIRAPFDGKVTKRNVHTGHYVQPGTAAMPPFVVAQTAKVRVVSEIPEVEAPYIQEGMSATVRVQTLRNRECTGKVARTGWSLSAKDRTLRIEIDAVCEDVFLPGMYAYVSLRGEFPERLTVPAAAIVTSGDQQVCFVLEHGKARRINVQLGLRSGNLVELLRKQTHADGETRWEPFTGEEEILIGNLGSLSDGQAVQPGKRS